MTRAMPPTLARLAPPLDTALHLLTFLVLHSPELVELLEGLFPELRVIFSFRSALSCESLFTDIVWIGPQSGVNECKEV
jgi:hypothetical protein